MWIQRTHISYKQILTLYSFYFKTQLKAYGHCSEEGARKRKGGRATEREKEREQRILNMHKDIWKWPGKTLEKTSWWSKHFHIITKTHFTLFSFWACRQPKVSNHHAVKGMEKILVNKIMAENIYAFLGLVHKSYWRVNFCAFYSCCLSGRRWPPQRPWKPKGRVGDERF